MPTPTPTRESVLDPRIDLQPWMRRLASISSETDSPIARAALNKFTAAGPPLRSSRYETPALLPLLIGRPEAHAPCIRAPYDDARAEYAEVFQEALCLVPVLVVVAWLASRDEARRRTLLALLDEYRDTFAMTVFGGRLRTGTMRLRGRGPWRRRRRALVVMASRTGKKRCRRRIATGVVFVAGILSSTYIYICVCVCVCVCVHTCGLYIEPLFVMELGDRIPGDKVFLYLRPFFSLRVFVCSYESPHLQFKNRRLPRPQHRDMPHIKSHHGSPP
ncbi:hypothetical protein J3458_003681 [Metarhizium acridum]|uniref:uncharacterized protein n=1 Tax=Metarhizium acridum TaxID=92637 RepID=UPI001C6B2619|nr:hypothetical protein J3458_003681 [Metarhizium acridum]